MNQAEDDVIEGLLREQFEGPIRDEGFSERLMQRLPHRRRATWPLWAGILAGVGGCWLALLYSPLLRTGWRDWVSSDWSASAVTVLLAMFGMGVLAFVWGLAEADDR